jgi:hypothetical protein
VIRKFALWIKVSLNSIYLKVRHNPFWPGVADIIMLEFIKANTDHYAKTLEKRILPAVKIARLNSSALACGAW